MAFRRPDEYIYSCISLYRKWKFTKPPTSFITDANCSKRTITIEQIPAKPGLDWQNAKSQAFCQQSNKRRTIKSRQSWSYQGLTFWSSYWAGGCWKWTRKRIPKLAKDEFCAQSNLNFEEVECRLEYAANENGGSLWALQRFNNKITFSDFWIEVNKSRSFSIRIIFQDAYKKNMEKRKSASRKLSALVRKNAEQVFFQKLAQN